MRQFNGGAVRDDNAGKPRYDLIPPEALLRVAKHYAWGAAKYGVDNYKNGMPREAFIESAFRHFEALRMGKTDEDHAAALVWNVLSIMWLECQHE
jgi:hypothetical protein